MSAFGFKSIFVPTGRGMAHTGGMGGDGSTGGGGGPSGPQGAYGRMLLLNSSLAGQGWSYNNYGSTVSYTHLTLPTKRIV